VDHRLKRSAAQLILAAVWSVTVLGLISVVDRSCFRMEPIGWRSATKSEAVPLSIRFSAIPTYLPDILIWPPKVIFFRERPSTGWWYGLAARSPSGAADEHPIAFWMGQGDQPYPKELERFSECMDVVRGGTCPPGWRYFSKIVSGQVLNVLSSLDPVQTKRILQGF